MLTWKKHWRFLGKYKVTVSNSTVLTRFSRKEKNWRNIFKNVGSLIGTNEDTREENTLSTETIVKLYYFLFRKDKLRTATDHNSLVKSALLCTVVCGHQLQQQQQQRSTNFHRKQIRKKKWIYDIPSKLPISSCIKCNESPRLTHPWKPLETVRTYPKTRYGDTSKQSHASTLLKIIR